MFLPPGSLVNLQSIGQRQYYQIHYLVFRHRLFEGANRQKSFVIMSERSPPYCSGPPACHNGIAPSAVPAVEWLIFSYHRRRFTWVCPEEVANLQGFRKEDFWPNGETWEDLKRLGFGYFDMCKLIGNAYHMRCAGVWQVASLMNGRLEFLGDRLQ